jgi:hypothetical protein
LHPLWFITPTQTMSAPAVGAVITMAAATATMLPIIIRAITCPPL